MTEVLESNLNKLLHNFINDPENSDNNFELAIYYDSIGQTASAVSYYLRTAERTKFDEIKYQAILRSAICFDIQGSRNLTVKGLLQHALTIMPKRPEAYFLLSRFYEREGNYHDCYLISTLGEKISDKNPIPPLILYVEYPGFYGIIFEKAVSSCWCGLCDESRKLFEDLDQNYELDEIHNEAVKNNLKRLYETKKDLHEVYKLKEMREFNWGKAAENEWFKGIVEKEVFEQKVYEKFFSVEDNDLVLDVGASVGPFTYTLRDKNVEKIYCFEPHKDLFKTLKENVEYEKTILINKAIGSVDGSQKLAGLFNEQFIETGDGEIIHSRK